jgi:hypothetical protein
MHLSSLETAETEGCVAPVRESIVESVERIHRVSEATTTLLACFSQSGRLVEAHCASCNSLSSFEDLHDPPPQPTALTQVGHHLALSAHD